MGIIEQAARRLEELKRAGVAIPEDDVEGATHRQGVAIAPAIAPGESLGIPANLAKRPDSADRADHRGTTASSKQIEIDLQRLAAMSFVTPDAPRSKMAEEFRVVKRPLIKNALGKGAAPIAHGNLIMVTSALPGEGKTFSAINLAISIAMELDNTVLLVDADVAKPSVARTLGISTTKGLLDVLSSDRLDLSDVLLRTNIDKLSILPSGTAHGRATELLASDAMMRLVDEMARRYLDRIIVFDSPPLLLTTEARALAAHMGQLVMVVESGKTTHAAVKQALATVEACPVKLMMLNKSTTAGEGSYYGYHAFKGYGHYGYGG